MRDKRYLAFVGVVLLVGAAMAIKLAQDPAVPEALPAITPNASVLLFKGDDDPHCQIIYDLVDKAEARYSDRITVMKFEQSPTHPWIKKYDVRFLPTVIFIGRDGYEADRIEGEGAQVEASLKVALADFENIATR